MAAIRHSPDRTDRTTSIRELERALRGGHLEAFVQRVFFDRAVSSAGVDGVAVDGPTGSHTPRGYTGRRMDDGNWVGDSLVPDAESAVDGGVEEGRSRGLW